MWVHIENEEDVQYFLRGAYLVSGSLTDPHKEYHLEFGVSYMNLSRDLATLIGEVLPQPKSSTRRGSYIVYYKESENIEVFRVKISELDQFIKKMESENCGIDSKLYTALAFRGFGW